MTSSTSPSPAQTDVVLKNPPCFRTAMLWGIGVAALIGAQRYRTSRNIRSSCDWAIGTFGVVGGTSWSFCTASYRARARQTRDFMEVMNNPEHKAEAEQFLRSRVETRSSDEEP